MTVIKKFENQLFKSTLIKEKYHYQPVVIITLLLNHLGKDTNLEKIYAISGYSSYFLYDLERSWVFDIFREEIVNNILYFLAVRFQKYIPSSIKVLFDFLDTQIKYNRPVYISFFEPLIVYGIEKQPIRLWSYCPAFKNPVVIFNEDEFIYYWNLFLQTRKRLNIFALSSKGIEPNFSIIAYNYLFSLVRNFKLKFAPINIKIPMGINAYEHLINDLIDEEIYKTERKKFILEWFSSSIYPQFYQTKINSNFLKLVSKIFQSPYREKIIKASEYFEEAYNNWLKCDSLIREAGEFDVNKFIDDEPKRRRVSDLINRAKESISFSLREIEDVIKI